MGDAFGDEDDQFDAGRCRLHGAVRGESGRHEDQRAVRAGRLDGFFRRVEDRQPKFRLGAAFAGSDAADDLGAVVEALLGVKPASLPRDSVNDDLRILVDKDAH